MIIKNKRRFIVKLLNECIHGKEQPFSYAGQGVPVGVFEKILGQKVFIKKDGTINKNVYMNSKELINYMNFCVEDRFIKIENNNLNITSLGQKFISIWYYPLRILNYSLVQHFLTLIVGFIIGLILNYILIKTGLLYLKY